jgi:hypothetical protein
MMEAACSSETSVDKYLTRQYIPEDNSELMQPVYTLVPYLFKMQCKSMLSSPPVSLKWARLAFQLKVCFILFTKSTTK